ncbi:hypothetical protein EXIGLDRAFT_720938 [Exidia glandulosa HHB12029]|uniref:Uncharacterized protein n=1 Tax=Exidia glandulosa HHB12029 TaxID=1314781 RepID=A0A165NGA3_EXIGL|nr:hypothetical protein EXIGLDRAFT_720938 [Exidia glandulosa HHB12029]
MRPVALTHISDPRLLNSSMPIMHTARLVCAVQTPASVYGLRPSWNSSAHISFIAHSLAPSLQVLQCSPSQTGACVQNPNQTYAPFPYALRFQTSSTGSYAF